MHISVYKLTVRYMFQGQYQFEVILGPLSVIGVHCPSHNPIEAKRLGPGHNILGLSVKIPSEMLLLLDRG